MIAAQTSTVRLAPNVANLPLRPPAVLARSVASLDILSGGRVELGLGAGAFWDAIAANGGPRLTPGPERRRAGRGDRGHPRDRGAAAVPSTASTTGRGAKPGPPPAHDVEIWLGAYKPRMLALTGAQADGWLPSMGYAELEDLPAMNAAIDAAAIDAGPRRPPTSGGCSTSTPGVAAAEQLAELTLEQGSAPSSCP